MPRSLSESWRKGTVPSPMRAFPVPMWQKWTPWARLPWSPFDTVKGDFFGTPVPILQKNKAPWSSRWFEEISVFLIWVALVWVALNWVALISVVLIRSLFVFFYKILTFITQHSQLGNSFSTHPNGTTLTKWNFYTLFHNNSHIKTIAEYPFLNFP